MKSNSMNAGNFGGLIELPASDNENGFADASWLALRSQLMDVSNNPIFPRKENNFFRVQAARRFLFSAVKVLVKI